MGGACTHFADASRIARRRVGFERARAAETQKREPGVMGGCGLWADIQSATWAQNVGVKAFVAGSHGACCFLSQQVSHGVVGSSCSIAHTKPPCVCIGLWSSASFKLAKPFVLHVTWYLKGVSFTPSNLRATRHCWIKGLDARLCSTDAAYLTNAACWTAPRPTDYVYADAMPGAPAGVHDEVHAAKSVGAVPGFVARYCWCRAHGARFSR